MAGTSKLKQVGKVLGGTGLVGGAGLGGYAYGGAKGLEQGRREGFEAGYRRAKKEDRSAAMALSQGAQMRSQGRQMKRPEPEPQKQNQSTNSPEPAEQNTDEPETNMKSASVLKRAVSGMRGEMSNDMQEKSHLEVRKHDGGYVIVDPETGEIKSDKPYASRSKAEKTKESMSGNTKTGEKGENLDRNEYFQNEAKEVLNRQNQLRRRKRKEQRKDNTATGGISGTAIGAAAAPMIGEIAPRRFENAASLASPIVTGLAGAGIGRSLSKNVPGEVDVENMETSMSDEPANPSAAKRMKNREGVDRKTVNIDYGKNQQKNKKYDFYHNKPGDSSNTMNQGSPDKEAKNSEGASYKQDIDMENDCGCDKTASTKEADEDPCWEGYEQIGMKTKDGKKVPNCVPKDDEKSARILASATQSKNIKEASTKEADEDPCWEGYEQYGMKEKDGKQVPNCVPKDNEKSARILSHAANSNSEKTAGGARMMQGQQQQMRQGQRQMSQGQRQMSQEQAKRMLMQEVQRRRQQMQRARQEAAQNGGGKRRMQGEQQNQAPQSAQAMQSQTSESRQSKKEEQEVDKEAEQAHHPTVQEEADRQAIASGANVIAPGVGDVAPIVNTVEDKRSDEFFAEGVPDYYSRSLRSGLGTGAGTIAGGLAGGTAGGAIGGRKGALLLGLPGAVAGAVKGGRFGARRGAKAVNRKYNSDGQRKSEEVIFGAETGSGEKQAMKKEAEYKIVEENGGFYVVNKETGEKKNEDPHDTKEDAREHQKALYANVKDASMEEKIASAYQEDRIDKSERDYLLNLKESVDKSGVEKKAKSVTQALADNSDTIAATGAGLMAAGSLAPPIQRAANSALDPIRRRIRYNRMEAERPDTGQPASARINRDVLEREYGIPQEGLSDEEAERRARKKVFRIVHDNAPEVTRMPSVARKVVDQQIKGGNPAAAMQQANNMASDAVSNTKSRTRVQSRRAGDLRDAGKTMSNQVNPNA